MTSSVRHETSSFYVVGGTLRRDAASYVERKADQQLYSALRQHEVCYVLTPRQMGKSSLMVRTAGKLREDGVAVVVLDLTAFGQNLSAEQWYNGLLDKLGQQLHLEDEIEEAGPRWEHVGPLQRWVSMLREVVLPNCHGDVVIFVDEIDAVRSLPFSVDEFFAGIRELYNRRTVEPDLQRLTFCLLGVATPSDLVRDTRTTPFNIGRRIELTDFSEDEAASLAQGFGVEEGQGRALLKRVLYWTGGHPYLTQRLCRSVAEDEHLESSKDVDRTCQDLFLSRAARLRDDNLLFVRERLLRSEVETASLLSLYAKIRLNKRVRDDEINPLVSVLRLSGITKVEEGFLKIRNRVYYEVFDDAWIISNLPGAELRRQRAAYLKGLKRAGVLSLAVLALVIPIGWAYLYQRDLAMNVTLKLPQPKVPVFWQSAYMRGSPEAQFGTLLVRTGLQNIIVFINDQEYGRTTKTGDLRIRGLSPGTYKIRAEKQGFQSLTQEAKIVQDSETQLPFKLQMQTVSGQIVIRSSPPGTSVSLDGRYIGNTTEAGDLMITAAAGEHTFDLSREGYLSKHSTDQLQLGKLLVIDGSMAADVEAQEWSALSSSEDVARLQSFIQKYPRGRFSNVAKSRVEQRVWNSVKDSDDLQQLDAFVQKFPGSRFEDSAKEKMTHLLKEQSDWYSAHASKDPSALERFLASYPGGRYAHQAREEIARLKDQQTILSLLKLYEESYNRQDMKTLFEIWPTMPAQLRRATQAKFSEAESVKLVLQLDDGQPEVAGDRAIVRGKKQIAWIKKDKSTSNDEYPFAFELVKEGTHWVISKGQ